MKIDFEFHRGSFAGRLGTAPLKARVTSEVDRLTDVVLCPPYHLAPVPCCAVTRRNLREGFAVSPDLALEQHANLVALLEGEDVRCHLLEPVAGLQDMCFTRDVAVATPFGLIALHPAMPHRQDEVDAFAQACERWRLPLGRITGGTIEGGDICIAREGLLLAGTSGERTTHSGIDGLAAPFREHGWDVVTCRFDADHLHLDTMFCMVDVDQAIACVELLEPVFLDAIRAQGISILPVPANSAASLGCNILSLGNRRIVASANDRVVEETLKAAGYDLRIVDVSQFAACGGGIHCLTQPINRDQT